MLMPQDQIQIYGARVHNLKDLTLRLPRHRLIVFCGVSGSGKSSMAFDTIYAEGQRRYVESLSVNARQLLGEIGRPEVDHIEGLSPAIGIDQKSASSNPRSTVGTLTDIYDYLRVLFAKVGQPYCYNCGQPITAYTPEQIVDELGSCCPGPAQLLAPVDTSRTSSYQEVFKRLRQRGFARVRVDGQVYDLAEHIQVDESISHPVEVVIDRLIIGDSSRSRLADSVETALSEGGGMMIVQDEGGQQWAFSSRFACPQCDIVYPELTPSLFSFNSPAGMCEQCQGLGTIEAIDPDLLVTDPSKSILDGAVELMGDAKTRHVRHILEGLAEHYDFDLHTPWQALPAAVRRLILYGSDGEEITFTYVSKSGREYTYAKEFEGLVAAYERRQQAAIQGSGGQSSPQYAGGVEQITEQFWGPQPCPACGGTRLRPESRSVRVGGKGIAEITAMTVEQAKEFFAQLSFAGADEPVAKELVSGIRSRLEFMDEVGVGYLTLDRSAPTLAGGEAQRIRLATQIGSGLAGMLYILDEPTIGLHPRDHGKLLEILCQLRDLGNTVLVVEHDPAIILSADYVVEFGPGAGVDGGQIIQDSSVEAMLKNPDSITGQYLSGARQVPIPSERNQPSGKYLEVRGARQHNLQDIDVSFPLGLLICVTGVSGSGKSTLVRDILYRALRRRLYRSSQPPGAYDSVAGIELVDKVINVDQSPIGRTPRSTPATYAKVMGPIRELYSSTPQAQMRGYKPGRFSFNVTGGRCEVCKGQGVKRVEMHFLPDVYVECDMCGGTRYNRETLDIRYKGKNIADILEMTAAEALEHFQDVPPIARILRTLCAVGLDYIKLGQSAPTLSAGEAQRLKLARELAKIGTGDTVYLLDEPTTGLHFADIEKLLRVLQRLVDAGNTVIVIEHNLDVIKAADYVIDLGPEGGECGGRVVATGTPEQVAQCRDSFTGQYLKEVLN